MTHRPSEHSSSRLDLDLQGDDDVKMESDSKTAAPARTGTDVFAHHAPSQYCFHCLTAFAHCTVELVREMCHSTAWSEGGDAEDMLERYDDLMAAGVSPSR